MDRLPYPVRPALPAPRRRPWRWPRLALALLIFASLLAFVGYRRFLGPTGVVAVVQVPKGAGAAAIGRVLEKHRVVRSGPAFALAARALGAEKKLRGGVFRVQGQGTLSVVRQLERAKPLALTVTFPEGWRAVDYARRLGELGFDAEAFTRLVFAPPDDLKPRYDEGPSLEGYLFPDTYKIPLDASARAIVAKMLARFDREVTPERTRVLSVLGLSVHGWVTLASIVQAETYRVGEMPWIAGVFLNRLERGMPLQSDPTVAYALGKRLPELDRAAGDFEVDSPYNTYLHPGLPPGPIDNPGEAALDAVLHAKRLSPRGKPYLYFFHARGRLFLNETFAGHLKDLNRYRYGQ